MRLITGVGLFWRVWLTVCLAGVPVVGRAANLYFDLDGATPGMGTADNITYNQSGAYWSSSAAGNADPVSFTGGNAMIFGAADTDFSGASFAINMDVGGNVALEGVTINCTNVTITFQGNGNTYLNSGQTWTVPRGVTLNERIGYPSGAMNFGYAALTLTGGGVVNFITMFGNNASSKFVLNDGGGGLTVNLFTNLLAGRVTYTNITLTSGTLNFATAAAADGLGSGKVVMAGGRIDNTSGSPMTLASRNDYSFQGGFTFGGSSSLNMGMSNVTISAASVITVASNTLTVPGAISGLYSLTKAGAGTLVLDGACSYSGVTTVSNGTLAINSSMDSAVSVEAGGALAGTGIVNGAVSVLSGGVLAPAGTNVIGTLTLNSNLTLSGAMRIDIDGFGNCDLLQENGALVLSSCSLYVNSPADIGHGDCVIASYTTLAGRFSNVYNLPPGYMVYYDYKSEKKIAVGRIRGTVMMIR